MPENTTQQSDLEELHILLARFEQGELIRHREGTPLLRLLRAMVIHILLLEEYQDA